MVDYTKATGSSGTMMIRDTGSTVEFWLKASSSTWAGDLDYGWTVNGSTGSDQFNFQSGGSWQKLRGFSVTSDQTVTFRIGDSGTSGLGGPTSFSHAIERSTYPNPPSAPRFANLTNSSVDVSFTDGSNNGDAIDSRQLGYSSGLNRGTVDNTIASDGSTNFHGFTPGSSWTVWARTHNSNGWSAWGPRAMVTFEDTPPAPSTPTISNPTMTTANVTYSGNGDGGSPVLEWRIGFGTSPTGPTSYAAGHTNLVTGLIPGVINYFWGQARNEWGWGDLSPRAQVKLPAGAHVNVGGIWKDAVPYVRVGGVWKPAEPYVRDLGVWMKPL